MKYMETAKRLSEAMAEMDIKANELADKSGVGKSSISHYMNGTHQPHNINAGKLAQVLKVNPQWLMGFDVDKRLQTDYTIVGSNKILVRVESIGQTLNSLGLQELLSYAEKLQKIDDYRKN